MKKTLFIAAILSLTFISTSFSQRRYNNGRQNNNRRPNTNKVVTEEDKEKALERYEKESKEKQDELIRDFLNELAIDDFQKEIIKQNLYTYIEKKKAIFKSGLKSYEIKDVVEKLDATHFLDIENILSEGVMEKIQKLIKGGDTEKKKKEKKKKNRD